MYSSRQYYGLSYRYVFWTAAKIGDDKHVYIVASQGFTEYGLSYFVFVLECTDRVDHVADIRIGVGVAVSKVNCIIIIGCSILETEAGVIWSITVTGHQHIRIILINILYVLMIEN